MDETSVRITPAGDLVEEAPPTQVRLLPEVDPADLAAWLPLVERGVRVLLPDVPGSLAIVREAVAYGVLGLVHDFEDEAEVEQAHSVVSRRAVTSDELTALTTVLRQRLETGSGAIPDPRTAPRVLLVAFNKQELTRHAATYVRLERWGAEAYVLTSRTLLSANPRMLPIGARVHAVTDPGGGWWPSRIERLLVLRAPRIVTGGAHRALGLASRRLPGPPGRLAGRALPVAASVNAARSRVAGQVHARAWAPLLVRVKPALVSRATFGTLPGVVGPLQRLDAVCAPGADSLALVWKMLTTHRDLRAISSMTVYAISEVVRERTEQLAAGKGEGR